MIRYGTNPIAWTNDDDHTLGDHISLETCLSDAAAIGFDGIEKGRKFPADPETLRSTLAAHGLDFVSGWHSLNLLTHSVEAEKAAIAPHLALLKHCGCSVVIVCETSNAIHGDPAAPLSASPRLPADAWPKFCADVEAIAEHCAAEGLTLAYHHHTGTVVETPDEVAAFMANAGPKTRLLFDTGHYLVGGGDPTEGAARYMDRTVHIHTKNVRPAVMAEAHEKGFSFLDAVRHGIFTVPGDPEGGIDFLPVLKTAAAHNYDGWLVVEAEQDPDVRNPRKYQTLGHDTLRTLARDAGLDRSGNA